MTRLKWVRTAAFCASTFLTLLAVLAVSGGLDKAHAQGPLLDSYRAFLGPSDHFNSRGARLSQPWQIIRQDRANYHKFGVRDPGDGYDSFFGSVANRNRMEQMILHGTIDPGAARRIVNNNVWVRVDIYRNFVNVTVE